MDDSVYFLTFATARTHLTPYERTIVFKTVLAQNRATCHVYAAVVMTDHVHVLLQPLPGIKLWEIAGRIKGRSSKQINASRNAHGSVWVSELYDRIVRNSEEYKEKLVYIVNNPVKAGLTAEPEAYEWLYVASRLENMCTG
jgi:putative transposase